MKQSKILIILVGLLFFVGCTNQPQEISKQKVSQKTNNQPKVMQETKLGPNNYEDLTKEYKGAILKTNMGDIEVVFYGEDSPVTVNNFLNLAKEDFYNETLFHRVIVDFMIQAGDPNSKNENWATHGMGGPSYKFKDEFNSKKLVKGSLAMANSGPNTNGSQFFIVTAEATPWLDGKHTNFGQVVDGMDIVDKIEAVETGASDHPKEDVKIESIELIKK